MQQEVALTNFISLEKRAKVNPRNIFNMSVLKLKGFG